MNTFIVEQPIKKRLDVYLSEQTGKTRSQINKLIEGGYVLLGGQKPKSGSIVGRGDQITVDEPQTIMDIVPQNIPLDILFEDGHIAVINKQRGLSAHPAGGAVTNTLVNALLHHFESLSGINGEYRPGIVHRLDKDTTGVMVVAKTDSAHLSLSRQIAQRTVKKTYRAVLEGTVKQDSGRIDAPIARSRSNRKKMAVDSGGRPSTTDYLVLERFEDNTYAEFDLKTGRTHQIRVHAAHIGHPVVGDPLYGFKKQRFNLAGQLLHSYKLEFIHPQSGQPQSFCAQPPDDFLRILKVLKSKR